MHNQGVSRQIVAYGAMGVSLAVLSLGTVGWALSIAEPTQTQASVVDAVAAPPMPVATPIPADNVVAGSVPAIAAALQLPADSSLPQGSQIKICDTEVKGWVRSESMRLNDSGVGLSIQVAAWRAGAAASAFDELEKGAQGCAQVSKTETADEFRAGVSSDDGRWASGVRRVGDVLIAVSASSGGTDPAQLVDRVLAEAPKVLKPRLATTCVDSSSTRANDHIDRDPYSGKYTGFRVASSRKLEDQPVISKSQLAEIKVKQPESTWKLPAAIADPNLAPIKVAPGSPPAPIGVDPLTALRDPAPLLVPLDKFVVPTTLEPSSDDVGLKEPAEPTVGDGVSVAMVPSVDNSGPGCGWDFASTLDPATTEADLAVGARKAVIDALLRDTATQGQRMVDALSWPTAYDEWVAKVSTAKSWAAYRIGFEAAKEKQAKAKELYDESLVLWREGTLIPIPPPVPLASPSDSGSPSPSGPTSAPVVAP